MKDTPIHVSVKTAFIGWPSAQSRRISYFYNFLFFINYFIKYFKFVYRKCGYGNFYHRYNVSPIHLHTLLCVGNFTKVVRVCADRLWSGQRLPVVWVTLA
jgi:hypothetical protein